MDPVNQQVRKSALNRFWGAYALSLFIVLISAYFLFNTPAAIFKNRIVLFQSTEAEETRLLHTIEAMTANLGNIIRTDEKYLSSTNDYEKGTLLGNLQEYQKNISDALVNLKNDSSLFTSPVSKKDSYNYITVFNSVVAYRNTITALQKTLEAKGGDASELLKVKSQLDLCSQQLEICKMLAAKPAAAPPAGGGGGGEKEKEADLQRQLDKTQADLAACQKAKAGTIVPIAAETPSSASGETKKAVTLFEAGQELYTTGEKTKNLIERRGILFAARQVLQKSAVNYPDKDKLNKILEQINTELKKLSNMG